FAPISLSDRGLRAGRRSRSRRRSVAGLGRALSDAKDGRCPPGQRRYAAELGHGRAHFSLPVPLSRPPFGGRELAQPERMNLNGIGSRAAALTRKLLGRESTWFAIYIVIVLVATQICVGRRCNNFLIFRAAFDHLVAGRDLYAAYPGEHADLFKYSP